VGSLHPIWRRKKVVGKAGFGRYSSKVTKPVDFDGFWAEVLNQAETIDLNPEIEYDPLRSSDQVKVYQIFYDSLGRVRIAGWYCVPCERAGPLPAIAFCQGYIGEPVIRKEWAKKGYVTVTPAPRGKLRSNRQFNPGYPGLLTHNIVDRNTYSYRGFYVDVWRVIDFLLSREEVDPNRIGVTGSSQGGGLSITTAAMRSEVKAVAAGAPFLCGFVDAIELTNTYPYQEINDYLRLYPERRPDVESTLAYFDAINFADKVSCPIIINIGLQDSTCPPETAYVLFDSIGSTQKLLYPYDGHGHDAGRIQHGTVIEEFFHTHLGRVEGAI